MHGDAVVKSSLNPDGTIYRNEVTILRSSGNIALDRDAIHVIQRAQPYEAWKSKDYDVYEMVTKFSWKAGPPSPSPSAPTEACTQDR